jgi:PleD family two-component response regulator
MPDLESDQRRRVLIVDQSADSRNVFRTVLERRGIEILEASDARLGLEIVRQQRPEVVVLDLEAEAADDASVRAAYESELADHREELVILGNLRRSDVTADQRLVCKPYHYGPLIRRIEQLIEHSANLRPPSHA